MGFPNNVLFADLSSSAGCFDNPHPLQKSFPEVSSQLCDSRITRSVPDPHFTLFTTTMRWGGLLQGAFPRIQSVNLIAPCVIVSWRIASDAYRLGPLVHIRALYGETFVKRAATTSLQPSLLLS